MATQVWRSELNPLDEPTTNSVAIHAEDIIETRGIYYLVVCHVDTFPRGKGFMPRVQTIRGGTMETGHAHIGLGEEAHAKAKAEGEKILAKKLAELAIEMEKRERLRAEAEQNRE